MVFRTVTHGAALEIVPLDTTGKSFAFRSANHINDLTNGEQIGLDFLANFISIRFADPKFS